MSHEWNPEDVYEVLADALVRQILAALNVRPRSAKDLAEVCDSSPSAVYRRLNVLVDYDLVVERTTIGAGGHHFSTFELAFETVEVAVDGSNVVVTVNGDDAARYEEAWPFEAD